MTIQELEIKELKQEVKDLEEEIDEKLEEILDLQQELSEVETRLDRKESEIEELEEEIKNLSHYEEGDIYSLIEFLATKHSILLTPRLWRENPKVIIDQIMEKVCS